MQGVGAEEGCTERSPSIIRKKDSDSGGWGAKLKLMTDCGAAATTAYPLYLPHTLLPSPPPLFALLLPAYLFAACPTARQ